MTFNQRLFISSVGSAYSRLSSFFPVLPKKDERGDRLRLLLLCEEILELYSVLFSYLSCDATLSEIILVTSLFYFFISYVAFPAMFIICEWRLLTDWFLRIRAIAFPDFLAAFRCNDFSLFGFVMAGRLGFVLPRVIFAAPTCESRFTGRLMYGGEDSLMSISGL